MARVLMRQTPVFFLSSPFSPLLETSPGPFTPSAPVGAVYLSRVQRKCRRGKFLPLPDDFVQNRTKAKNAAALQRERGGV